MSQPPPDRAGPKPSLSRALGALIGEDAEAIERRPEVALRALGALASQAAGLLRDATVGTQAQRDNCKERLREVRQTLQAEGFPTGEALESLPDRLHDALHGSILGDALQEGTRRVSRAAAESTPLPAQLGDLLREGADSLKGAAAVPPRPPAEDDTTP